MNEEKQLRVNGESRCPVCRKLLTKPTVRIKCIRITMSQFYTLMRDVELSFGAQSQCRRCKALRETEEVIAFRSPAA